jgi:hypothetical protein
MSSRGLIVPGTDAMTGTPWFPQSKGASFIFELLEMPEVSKVGKWLSITVLSVIVFSVVSFCLESDENFTERPAACADKIAKLMPVTEEDCKPQAFPIFATLEAICIIFFTCDYLPRVLTVHAWEFQKGERDVIAPSWYLKDAHCLERTLRYMREPLNIVDLLAIIPWYLEIIAPGAFQGDVLRVIRLLRVVRIFKLMKTNPTITILAKTLKNSWPAISLLIFFNVLLMVLFGALIFLCESSKFAVDKEWTNWDCSEFNETTNTKCRLVCPDGTTGDAATCEFSPGAYIRPTLDRRVDNESPFELSPFMDIPMSFWWVLTTMTTVGYGDFYPTTVNGKVIAVICFYVGIVFVAMPISIIGCEFETAFTEYEEKKNEKKIFDKSMSEFKNDLSNISLSSAMTTLVDTENLLSSKATREADAAEGEEIVDEKDLFKSIKLEGPTPLMPEASSCVRRVFLFFEDPDASQVGLVFSFLMVGVIILSIVNFLLTSMSGFVQSWEENEKCKAAFDEGRPLVAADCEPVPKAFTDTIEMTCVLIFTVEYLFRVLTVWSMPVGRLFKRTKLVLTAATVQRWKREEEHLNEEYEKPADKFKKPKFETELDKHHRVAEMAKHKKQWETNADRIKRKHNADKEISKLSRTLTYMKLPLNVVDLMAILPFYLGEALPINMTWVRVFRLFRVLKMGKLSSGVEMFFKVFQKSLSTLSMLSFLSLICAVLFGSMIYFAEGATFKTPGEGDDYTGYDCSNYEEGKHHCVATADASFPHGLYIRATADGGDIEPTPFRSIVFSFWWVFTTMTTVGYGDFFPTSTIGRIVGVLVYYFGILTIALPVTVFGSNFTRYYGIWLNATKEDTRWLLEEQKPAELTTPLPEGNVSKHDLSNI